MINSVGSVDAVGTVSSYPLVGALHHKDYDATAAPRQRIACIISLEPQQVCTCHPQSRIFREPDVLQDPR
ncbi:MAG: hypothetical protein WCE82_07055 [Halobacteriota archaeon]